MNEPASGTFNRTIVWLSHGSTFVACMGGLFVGLVVLGIGGRIAMLLIALALGLRLHWSWGGTAQVVLVGAAVGPLGGLLLAAISERLPGSTVVKGAIFGALFGSVWTAIYFLRPAGPMELSVSPVLGVVLFGGLLLLFGVTLAGTLKRLEGYTSNLRISSLATGVVVTLVTLFGTGLGLFALLSR